MDINNKTTKRPLTDYRFERTKPDFGGRTLFGSLNAAALGAYDSVPGLNKLVALGRSVANDRPYKDLVAEQEKYLEEQSNEYPFHYGAGQLAPVPLGMGAGRLAPAKRPKMLGPNVRPEQVPLRDYYSGVDNRGKPLSPEVQAKIARFREQGLRNLEDQTPYGNTQVHPSFIGNSDQTGVIGGMQDASQFRTGLGNPPEYFDWQNFVPPPVERRVPGNINVHTISNWPTVVSPAGAVQRQGEKIMKIYNDGSPIGQAIVFNKDPLSINEFGRTGRSLKDIHINPEYQGQGVGKQVLDQLTEKYGPLASDTRGTFSEAGRQFTQKYGEKQPDGSFIYRPGDRLSRLLEDL